MTISRLLIWFHDLENWEQLICWPIFSCSVGFKSFRAVLSSTDSRNENLKFHDFSMTWTHFPKFNDFTRCGIRISNPRNFHGRVNVVPVKPLDHVDLGLRAHPNWLGPFMTLTPGEPTTWERRGDVRQKVKSEMVVVRAPTSLANSPPSGTAMAHTWSKDDLRCKISKWGTLAGNPTNVTEGCNNSMRCRIRYMYSFASCRSDSIQL